MVSEKVGRLIDALSPKRAMFVREYLIDLNATQAAVRAGYSAKTAKTQGARLLTDEDIAAAVAVAMDERAARTDITADRVLEEVARLAFLDVVHLLNPDGTLKRVDEMSPEARAALAGLEVLEMRGDEDAPVALLKKIKLTDKLGALTLLMRHMGMLNDKLKVGGDPENPLTMLIREIQGSALKPVKLPPNVTMKDEEDAR